LLHVILCAVGSAGDVHPFVGLGRALQKRGCRITLMTAGYFQHLAEQSGFEFVDTLPGCDYHSMLNDPQIWHPIRGTRKVMDLAVRPTLRHIYEGISHHYDPRGTQVVASTLAFGARVAQEKLGIQLTTVHLSPALFRSQFEGPRLPKVYLHRGPGWFKRFQWYMADRYLIDPMITPWLNSFRQELGLPPAKRILKEWWNSPQRVLAFFPEWFAARQPDWPQQTRLTGFPLYSEEGITEPSAALVQFLAAGSKPIAFTPGSANLFGQDFFQAAAETCRQLGRRGILLTRFGEQIPPHLPDGVRHFDFAPFRWLLPRVEMLVHHGGVGSMSQAMAAGIPQIIMPMAFDQVDNAYRVTKLGIGKSLARERFNARKLGPLIQSLLNNPQVQTNCETIAKRLAANNSLDLACDEIMSAG
jgi:rhamnosyltransferase subunit B